MGLIARFWLRRAPKPSDGSSQGAFTLPAEITGLRPLTEADFAIVQRLSSELMRAGVLDRHAGEPHAMPVQSADELSLMLNEAAAAAQTEQQSNSAFYDPSVEEILLSKDYADKIYSEDPSLDGLDDEGIQVYESFTNEARLDTPEDRVYPSY